ncbi:LPXTG cell wall anchor domain-containing protein [Streptomyces sp. A7024]|uniref:LPXTG cell wall anchor domain-containing protein n=1 Tax=Streptomyces coryli TaxID=1128680 RepID=A0A6G4U5W5_9ACTN|nr:SCO1860 family LAETG-anchored protein [Streptomyces coryli]NGN66591.1 LPXTG cell wall anchor domain-containing protein [Streptomyces coryli]
MNSTAVALTARRTLTTLAATALIGASAPVLAHAANGDGTSDSGDGRAAAAVLRSQLDVSLLNKTVNVPLRATLNEVQAPKVAEKTALTLSLDGVDKGQPFRMLGADVATAKASADKHKAEAMSRLAHAKVHVPGLPALSLIEVGAVTSTAVCAAGEKPVADSKLVGPVRILGKKLNVTAGGAPAKVTVPGVGEVSLGFSQTHTTDRDATAAALKLKVSVNPLKLNVAEVEGEVALVEASCTAPSAPKSHKGKTLPAPVEKKDVKAQGAAAPAKSGENLAETGGDSSTPYLIGGAAILVGAGLGSLALARKRAGR